MGLSTFRLACDKNKFSLTFFISFILSVLAYSVKIPFSSREREYHRFSDIMGFATYLKIFCAVTAEFYKTLMYKK